MLATTAATRSSSNSARAIRVLAFIGALLLTCSGAFATSDGSSHKVEFIDVLYDFPQPGRSTWYYKVTSGSSPSISHVNFELDLDCVEVLDAGTWGPDLDDMHSGGGHPSVGTDPTTGFTGIKFDEDFSSGQKRRYYFTLDANYPTDTIKVVIKAGHTKVTTYVTGPACIGDEPQPCVSKPEMCDDGNSCTDDLCDPEQGCRNLPNTKPCDDGQLCTENDTCSDGVCTGVPFVPPSCEDDNVCTDNACDPQANGGAGGCVVTNNTAPCDDGLFCTVGDQCSGGQCVTSGSVNCDDGDICTLDECDEQTKACRNTGDPSKVGQACDDMSLCTDNDVCDANGSCAGTPIVCDDDDDVCTADSCDPAVGCVFDVVVESHACMSCMDGIDNEGDGDTDNEDCGCNPLCDSFKYAVVASRDSTRRTVYFGKKTSALKGLDPDLGSASSGAPYPLGPSVSSACSLGKLELLERAVIDGVGTGATRSDFGNGNYLRLGFFTGFVPPGQLRTTGTPPFVGPRVICSDTPLPCTDDSQCPQGESCRPLMTIVDPDNEFVDLTGAHDEFVECESAAASLPSVFAALFTLPPTQDLGNLRYRDGGPPIVVTGPGVHVVRFGALRTLQGSTLRIVGDENTEAVVFQIERTLTIGVRSRVELVGGLKPDQVIWVIDRSGRVYIGNQETEPPSDDLATLPGTLLAPDKNIVVGKKARIAGAALGYRVQLNEKAVIAHRPFIALP